MKSWKYASVLAMLVLASCSGGGSAGNASSGSSTSSVLPPTASTANATGTLTIAPNAASATTASTVRKPAYISPSTQFATLFIDGATTGERQACNAASPCTFNWTSTAGQHTFAVETDDSASIGGGGAILSEGEGTYLLSPGVNTLATLTLDSVVGQVIFEQETLEGSSQCYFSSQNCFIGTFGLADAEGWLITGPGDFTQEFQPVSSPLIAATAFELVSAPDSSGNDYVFKVVCTGTDGQFGIVAGPVGGTLASSPDISAGQATAYSLVIPSVAAINWPQYQCADNVISGVGPANGAVTVQGTKR